MRVHQSSSLNTGRTPTRPNAYASDMKNIQRVQAIYLPLSSTLHTDKCFHPPNVSSLLGPNIPVKNILKSHSFICLWLKQ
jgi:hypothetical protein